MAATYEPIATTTLGSAASSVTFSSISSAYTDLIFVGNFVQSASTLFGSLSLRFNGDTTTNYSYTGLQGTGGGAGSFRASNSNQMDMGSQNVLGDQNIIIQIQNYANTSTYKTALSRYNNSNGLVMSYVGLWRKTPEAINSLVFFPASAQFATGSTFTLYGILAA